MKGHDNLDAFIIACWDHNLDAAKEALSLQHVNSRSSYGQLPLEISTTNDLAITRWLLLSGADPTICVDTHGKCLLQRASDCGYLEIAKLFHDECGMSWDCANYFGRTPLYHAITCDRESQTRWLMDQGAKDTGRLLAHPPWYKNMMRGYNGCRAFCDTVFCASRAQLGRDVALIITRQLWETHWDEVWQRDV